jgi:hypothetical protein
VYKMVLFVIWLVALVGADLDWISKVAIWSSVIEHNVALWMPMLLLISKGGLFH